MRQLLRWLPLGVLLACLPAWAGDIALADVLAGNAVPLSLKLQELTAAWKVVSVDSPPSPIVVLKKSDDQPAPEPPPICYTTGQTASGGGESYLIVYHRQPLPVDIHLLEHDEAPKPPPLTAETPLVMSLLNLRTLGKLMVLRPFNLAKEIVTARYRRPEDVYAEVIVQLKRLNAALLMYAQDHDDAYPDAATWQHDLAPQVGTDDLFHHPLTGEAYGYNPRLSKKTQKSLAHPAEIAVLYEAQPAEDGQRAVAFADGHVVRVPDTKWAEIRRTSGIP